MPPSTSVFSLLPWVTPENSAQDIVWLPRLETGMDTEEDLEEQGLHSWETLSLSHAGQQPWGGLVRMLWEKMTQVLQGDC